jgi:hypothetical protein
MNKQKMILVGGAFLIFAVGFFSGMEYKAYEIRSAFQEAFSTSDSSESDSSAVTVMEQAKEEDMQIIEKKVGEEVALATMNLTVTSADEKQTLSPSYGSPKVAQEGTKFVVVKLEVTNTTSSEFTFSPDLLIVDSQNREFSTYSDSIGAVPDYLNYRELSPSISETGSLVYELPSDATGYSLLVAKAGTKELYKIALQ